MHILYLQQLLILPGCAGNDRSFEFAQNWQAAGHKITVIASNACLPPDSPYRGQGPYPRRIEVEGMTIYLLKVPYDHLMSFPRRVWAFLSFYQQALRLGKKLSGFDRVLAWSAPLSVGELGRKLAAYHQVPFALEVADVWPDVPIGMGIIRNRWLINWLHRRTHRIYRAAAAIFPFSEGMRDQLLTHDVPLGKITVIHNGAHIGDPLPARKGSSSQSIEVLYAGTIGKANGLLQLVGAARILQQSGRTDIHITILGTGNEAALVKSAAVEAQLENLQFLEAVSREEIPHLLVQADIGVISFAPFPVLEANGATKFMDYLACGLPIVLNYEGWQAKYLSQYKCGLAAPQGDVAAFTENLIRLADDPALRIQMGLNGQQLAKQVFDRKMLAGRMLEKIVSPGNEHQLHSAD